MKLTKEELEKLATEYAENEDCAYSSDYFSFINGFNKAVELMNEDKQKELKNRNVCVISCDDSIALNGKCACNK